MPLQAAPPAPIQAPVTALTRLVPDQPSDAFGLAVGLPSNWSSTRPLASAGAAARRAARIRSRLVRIVAAGDRIARTPYVYGGGHGSFSAAGYDCSGSVSYVLHAAGLLAAPADSSALERYGLPGPGRHVTVYANGGHALMTIDGRRFDTIAFQESGTRWSDDTGDTSGYVVRHPRGL